MWTIDANKNKSKNRRNSHQIGGDKDLNTNTDENIIQATSQKFGNNGKIAVKKSSLGHEGKYTPKYVANNWKFTPGTILPLSYHENILLIQIRQYIDWDES